MSEMTPEWKRLMQLAEAIKFGEARVVFQNGKPTRVDCTIKQIKLDSAGDFKEGLETIPLT